MQPEAKKTPGATSPRVPPGAAPAGHETPPTVGGLFLKHQAGARDASAELVALVAEEIRRIAAQQRQDPERGTRPAAEQLANLSARILSDSAVDPSDRGPFLAIYARAVRRVVADRLRQPSTAGTESAGSHLPPEAPAPEMILAIDDVLTSLERVNARLVSTVECLYFARLTEEETAAALRADGSSVQREWVRARAWLLKELTAEFRDNSGRREVSVTNAVWVDAVLRNALALPHDQRGEFLEQCHAAAPGLRKDVEHLLRLSAPEVPGPNPGDLSLNRLWSILSGHPAPPEAPRPVAPAAVEARPIGLEDLPPIGPPFESDPASEPPLPAAPAAVSPQPSPPASTPAVAAAPRQAARQAVPDVSMGPHASVRPDAPLPSHLAAAPPAAAITIEGWRIVRDLESSELGALYLVERQHDLSRAALRVLPLPPATIAMRQQFALECRTLSAVHHPRVARIIDTGETDDGRLFVVRAYVEGRRIDRYCDEELLTVAQRVQLVLRVCTVLQHAHRKLVAHGGIQPSNVIVSDDGDVTLVDGGLTPLIGSLAAMAGVAWRPGEHASPEQLRGEPVAVGSDVYQLGSLLCELLTGERARRNSPGQDGHSHEVPAAPSIRVQAAPEKVPAARRTNRGRLVRMLRGDLDAITLLALRDDPDKRYPSISAFRSDLQRWLDKQPVWARRDTVFYRADRFLARRRIPLMIGGAAVIVAAVSLPGPLGERLRSARDVDRAEQVNQVLAGLLVPPDAGVSSAPPTARTYVDRAAGLVRTELARQPAEQGRLLTTIGRAYGALGHYQEAIDVFEETLLLRRAAHGDDSLEVAEVLEPLGFSRHMLGRFDEAESTLRMASAIRLLKLGASHPATIRANTDIGMVLHTRGHLLEAEQVLRAALGSVRAAVAGPGEDIRPAVQSALASVLRDRGLLAESATLFGQAVASFRAAPAGSAEGDLARTQVQYAALLLTQSQEAEADSVLAEAVPALRRIHHADHPILLDALWTSARLRMAQARMDEARILLDEAQRVQGSLQTFHVAIPTTRGIQAELARRQGRFEDAIASARLALDEFERLELAEHPTTVEIRATLGEALVALGRREEAVPVLGRGLTIVERLLAAADPRHIRLRTALVDATGGARR